MKSYCRNCRGETNHEILKSDKDTEMFEGHNIWISTSEYFLIKCKGCETLTFKLEFLDQSSFFVKPSGEVKITPYISLYPLFLKDWVPLNGSMHLPHRIKSLYYEILNSLKVGNSLLTTAGFRAIIEGICKDLNIEGKNLEKKISNLKLKWLITESQENILHGIRSEGNKALHEMEFLSEEALFKILDVVETLLKGVYIQENEVFNLVKSKISNFDFFIKLAQRDHFF
jgi:hypothetical protein